MSQSLFADVRQQVIEALCDIDGMKWSDATDLVDKLVAMAPASSLDLGVRTGMYPRHEFDWTPCSRPEPHGWHPWQEWQGDYLKTRWCHGIETACPLPDGSLCGGCSDCKANDTYDRETPDG